MSNISIKKDFVDNTILPAQDLNNNFMVIEAGVNSTQETLEESIAQSEVRLRNIFEEIAALRGWNWRGLLTHERVTFFKGDTSAVNRQPIDNGQLLYDTSTGETKLDANGLRLVTGSGNVVQVGGEEPTNPATKIWIENDFINRSATEVIDSLDGNEVNMAPSVHAVNSRRNAIDALVDSSKTTGNAITVSANIITKIPLMTGSKIGNKLSIFDGGVKIGVGITHVEVSANVYFQNVSSGSVNAYIYVNNTQVARCITMRTSNYQIISIPSKIIRVNEGDVISLRVNSEGSTANIMDYSGSTYLTVKQI